MTEQNALPAQDPTVRLISSTTNPIETVAAVWAQSRPTQYPHLMRYVRDVYKEEVVTAEHILSLMTWRGARLGAEFKAQVLKEVQTEEVFRTIINMDVPISECVHFTWGFSSLPVEWREQAVRKRQWGFWLTSMREFSMENFFDEGRYALPPEGDVSDEAIGALLGQLKKTQDVYRELLSLGAPQEIARKVIPSCATHNGTMFSTLRTLLGTFAARSCWIAQLGLWGPVLLQMAQELRNLHPLLGQLISPPCFKRGSETYQGCRYPGICENRMTGKDKYATCPLYVFHERNMRGEENLRDVFADFLGDAVHPWARLLRDYGTEETYREQGVASLYRWRDLWGRHPFTGTFELS